MKQQETNYKINLVNFLKDLIKKIEENDITTEQLIMIIRLYRKFNFHKKLKQSDVMKFAFLGWYVNLHNNK